MYQGAQTCFVVETLPRLSSPPFIAVGTPVASVTRNESDLKVEAAPTIIEVISLIPIKFLVLDWQER